MSWDKIYSELKNDEVKIVSFDIFDTLLLRPATSPTDMFKIVGSRCGESINFMDMRKNAEQVARKRKPFYNDDITIDDIYFAFQDIYGYSEEKVKSIKQVEMDVEFNYLRIRKSVKKLFDLALAEKKRVIITSDMYLPKDFLDKVLKKNGYNNYERLYVSSELKISKGSGRLFDYILADYEELGYTAANLLHVGDNYHADIKVPSAKGIKTLYIPSCINIMKKKNQLADLVKEIGDSDNSFLLGLLANHLFDDHLFPFDNNSLFGKYKDANLNIGKILFAPLLISFCKWKIEDAIKEDLDLLTFIYRDGYIPKIICDDLLDHYETDMKTNTMYMSRAMRYSQMSRINNGFAKSFYTMPPSRDMSVKHFIEKRLFITNKDQYIEVLNLFKKIGYSNETDKIGPLSNYHDILTDLESYFIDNTKQSWPVFDEYCASIFEGANRIGTFDIGYRGSVSRYLKDTYDIDNVGYHLFAFPRVRRDASNYNLKTFIEYPITTRTKTFLLHYIVEDVISIQEGSVIGIEKNNTTNDWNYLRQKSVHSNEMDLIQKGIIEFSKDFISTFNTDIKNLVLDASQFFDLLKDFLVNPKEVDARFIKNIKFADSEFINDSATDVYLDWYNMRCGTEKKTIKEVVESAEIRKKVGYEFSKGIAKKIGILPYMKKIRDNNRDEKKHEEFTLNKRKSLLSKLESTKSVPVNFENDDDEVVLVAGNILGFDKGTCSYLNNVNTELKQTKLLLLSQYSLMKDEDIRKKINFDFIVMPKIISKDYYEKDINLKSEMQIHDTIASKTYLQNSVNNLKERHYDMGDNYAEYIVYYTYLYFKRVLNTLLPKKVVLWNQFHAVNHILENICKEEKIEILFYEFGVLPGTFSIDTEGQMGESAIATNSKKFKSLKVTEEEICESKNIISYMKEEKLNRNIKRDYKRVLPKIIEKNKPIILYAGQNDFESGLVPYTDRSQKYHSPTFNSSHDALLHLSELAEKNDWNLIYKPHPIMKWLNSDSNRAIPENVNVIYDMDILDLISKADVVITILSQVSYLALIHEKPVIMLGYNQLVSKECTYEAFNKGNVEKELLGALDRGYTRYQQENFEKHVAQLNKYYLFDDLAHRNYRYGRNVKQAVGLFEK